MAALILYMNIQFKFLFIKFHQNYLRKWMEWMAEILFSFHVRLDVCVCLCAAALNANTSKTVKATDFKFDAHVPRDSPDMTP